MNLDKKTTKTMRIAGFIILVLGVVVAFLNGKGIISTSEQAPDYIMLLGIVLYFWGRQVDVRRKLSEDMPSPDSQDEDEQKDN